MSKEYRTLLRTFISFKEKMQIVSTRKYDTRDNEKNFKYAIIISLETSCKAVLDFALSTNVISSKEYDLLYKEIEKYSLALIK